MQVLALGGRNGAYASSCTMLRRLISPRCVPPYAQVRQTMMLAIQRELQSVPWLLRCVADEVCALMCVLCAGFVGVISAIGASV